ncbi:hypothetical protein MHUMG1_06298 [Metarhizium humberi]|uniref:Uncharacterized protein n=1 Tax=Metarhizium humberi TaxID=2596975 RepID=A0A9P8MBV7_9HYPO|nr:hypothetical protein MHUMG1_06298 [Metarhizium humberi]
MQVPPSPGLLTVYRTPKSPHASTPQSAHSGDLVSVNGSMSQWLQSGSISTGRHGMTPTTPIIREHGVCRRAKDVETISSICLVFPNHASNFQEGQSTPLVVIAGPHRSLTFRRGITDKTRPINASPSACSGYGMPSDNNHDRNHPRPMTLTNSPSLPVERRDPKHTTATADRTRRREERRGREVMCKIPFDAFLLWLHHRHNVIGPVRRFGVALPPPSHQELDLCLTFDFGRDLL